MSTDCYDPLNDPLLQAWRAYCDDNPKASYVMPQDVWVALSDTIRSYGEYLPARVFNDGTVQVPRPLLVACLNRLAHPSSIPPKATNFPTKENLE